MKQHEEITIQTLANSDEVQIGYSDNDIVVVKSVQQFAEISSAHVAMNVITICTRGKVQALMNGETITLTERQLAIVPENFTITDLMVSPDFDLKALFITSRALQSFLREKMYVWNDIMYIHRLNIITLDDSNMTFYTHFYDMLCMAIENGKDNPFQTEIVQSLIRSAIFGLCGALKQMRPSAPETDETLSGNVHFQHFLDLLHNSKIRYRPVEAYADQLCISPKYLTAICKKQSGKTANEWIRQQVLEDIRYYLKQTDLSIKEICDQLGFPNPSFFGKYVKTHFGMTPMQFKAKG